MGDPINTAPPPSAASAPMSNVNTQTPVTKQVFGVSFGDKLNAAAGQFTSIVANGANTVFGAMGFRAGQAAASTLSDAGMKLSQMGAGSPTQISTQVHGLSNSMGPNGSPAVALGPGSNSTTNTGTASFGAGTGGPTALKQNQTGPAFGAGAIGLDGSSGLSGGVSAGGGVSSTGGSPSGAIGSAAGGDSQGALLNATKAMQETQMSFNLQYLQLQSQMQSENRSYTAVSNIMKTKHDTVKNSISNVR